MKGRRLMADVLFNCFSSVKINAPAAERRSLFVREVLAETLNLDKISEMLNIPTSNTIQSEILLKSMAPFQTLWGNLVITGEVVRSIKEIVDLKKLFPDLMAFLHVFYKKIAFPLSLYLSNLKLKNTGNKPNEIDPAKKEFVEMSFELLSTYMEVMYLVTRRIKKTKHFNVELSSAPIAFVEYLEVLLNLRVGDLFVSQRNLVFMPSNMASIDYRITQLKLKVIEVLFYLLEFVERLRERSKAMMDRSRVREITKTRERFYQRLNGTLRLLSMSIIDVYSREDLDLNAVMADVELSDLISWSLKIIGVSAGNYLNMATVNEFKFELVHKVLLLNIVSQEEELINLAENPSEFVNYHFAIIEFDKKEETLKSISVVALDYMTSAIDGLDKYVLHLLTNIVTVCLKMQNPNELSSPEDTAAFAQLTKSRFWTHTSLPSKIETCLLLFGKFWDVVQSRADLVHRFEEFFLAVENHLGRNCDSLLVQCRFMLMVGYYCDVLFKKNADKIKPAFQWVCDCIARKDVLGRAAGDILILLGRNKFFIRSRQEYGEMLWKAVIMGLQNPDPAPSFLNLILEMLENFETALMDSPSLLEALIGQLVVLVQHLAANGDPHSRTTQLNRVWNILRFACENEKYYSKFGQIMEAHISKLFPLVNTLKDPNANCDEDIVDCVIAWTKHSNGVSDIALGLIGYFENIQNKDSGRLNKLYILLNNFFRFAKDKFSAKDVFMCLKMAEACLSAGANANDHKRSPMENASVLNENFSQGFLLLQLLVQTMHDRMTPEMVAYSMGLFTKLYETYLPTIRGKKSPLRDINTPLATTQGPDYYTPNPITARGHMPRRPGFGEVHMDKSMDINHLKDSEMERDFYGGGPGLGMGNNNMNDQILPKNMEAFGDLEPTQESYFVDKMFGMFLLMTVKFPQLVLPPLINGPELAAKPFLHISRILDVLFTRAEEFTTEYDRKLLICSLSQLIQFFLAEIVKSESPQAYFLLEQLVCKTVMTIKLFQIAEKARKELLMINTDMHQGDISQFSAHLVYELIQIELGMTRAQPSSDFDRFLQDTEFATGFANSKETLVTELNSIFDKVNELKEFRTVMIHLKNLPQVYQRVCASLRPVPKAHFVHVCFQFEDIDRGDHGKVYRRVVKIRQRRKK